MKSLSTRKKGIFITCIIFSIIVLSIAIFAIYRINHPVYTFDEITNNLFSQYDHTNWENKEVENGVVEIYKNFKYELYSGKLGSTRHDLCLFYDNNNNLLFEINFIGNRNIIQVTIDGETKTYIGNKGY